MLRYIKKIRLRQTITQDLDQANKDQASSQTSLSTDLVQNLKLLRGVFGPSPDIHIREFAFGESAQINAALLFLEGMTDKDVINDDIIKPLMYQSRFRETLTRNLIDVIQSTMLAVGQVRKASFVSEVINECLSGNTILLIEGAGEALVILSGSWAARAVEEPRTELTVRGPREGFTESLGTNATLIRRKIKNPNFTMESMQIGEQTKTTVSIAYLKGITNLKLVEETRRRLSRIKTDSILESGYIEQFIEDAPFSIFATVGNSEKPDVVAAKILEGRAAILVDGSPFVLTVPMVFIESFQSSEDYYSRPYFVSVIRMIRFIAFFISIVGPAAYVALSTYHQELIPTTILFTMVASQEGVAFPAVMEALIMGVVFEILREAGVRLPRPVGQAVSIVGALVIGESAVSAGLIGEPMVVVVALTAVAGFVVAAQTDSGGIMRFILVILSGFMGGFGIMIGLIFIYIHLVSLRSFGVPYLSPFAPLSPGDLKDTFVRLPLWKMFLRPRAIGWHDPQRQEFKLKPENPVEESKNEPK